jgi:pimeloyl-ACP methyl ester carboxylesterase
VTRGRLALVLTAAAACLALPAPASAARLEVPLDHSGAVPGKLVLRVNRSEAFRPSGAHTLVLPSVPGAPAADPWPWSDLLRDTLVTFDPRGTGRRALRCRDLEAATLTDAGREAAACAVLLGERRRFYRAADTVEDIELLRASLGVERLTIVGPGYGSYVAQRYALRYPQRVERLILTSPVDAAGLDPLFRDSVAAARRVLGDLCRGPACNGFTSDPVADTQRLIARLAAAPLRGTIVDPEGRRRAASLSRQELLFTLLASDDNVVARVDYPAAVFSALDGDAAPLLRLKRRATRAAGALYPRRASIAAAAAATCEEVRFPWAWHASPAERAEAAHSAEAEMAPAVASPFDPGTLVRTEPMRLCGRWPTASPGPPAEPGPMPDVPVLLLAESDDLSGAVETATRTAERFQRAHVLATADLSSLDECAERAVRRFMRGERVQDRCPPQRSPIPPTEPLPTSLAELAPVRGVPGRRGKLVRATAATIADLIDDFLVRLFVDPERFFSGRGLARGGGLRGGSFTVRDNQLTIERYEFVPGVRLSGRWDGDRAVGPLHIDGPGRLDGRLRLGELDEDLVLRSRGRIAGRHVQVRVRVPTRLVAVIEEEIGGLARATALPWLRCGAPRSSCRP